MVAECPSRIRPCIHLASTPLPELLLQPPTRVAPLLPQEMCPSAPVQTVAALPSAFAEYPLLPRCRIRRMLRGRRLTMQNRPRTRQHRLRPRKPTSAPKRSTGKAPSRRPSRPRGLGSRELPLFTTGTMLSIWSASPQSTTMRQLASCTKKTLGKKVRMRLVTLLPGTAMVAKRKAVRGMTCKHASPMTGPITRPSA